MKLLRRDVGRLKNVDLMLCFIFYEVQKRTQHDIHIGYQGGRRSAAEQNDLYKSKKSSKDGYKKLSKHQKGIAIDFVVYKNGKAVWYPDVYEDVWYTFLAVSKEFRLKLRWGGDWNRNGIRVDKDKNEKFLDAGHVEMI
jgi:hypothetical protein